MWGRLSACWPAFSRPRAHNRLRGQATVEYALTLAGILIPVIFGIIYLARILWLWHSMVEFTREGALYAATHCWQAGGSNVVNYMQSNVPVNLDQAQFSSGGAADIQVNYYSIDPSSGALTDFSCDTDCSSTCIPDTVTVRVANYQFNSFVTYLKIQPISMPDFSTSAHIEGAGCDPEQGTCTP
jgi:hypothetical protein